MKSKLLAGACLCLAASLSGQPSLLHFYDFSSGVIDLAGSANGTLVSGAVVSGGALVLNGDGARVTFETKLLPAASNFTLTFFAQVPSLGLGTREIISQGGTGVEDSGFYVGYDDDELRHIRLGDDISDSGVAFPSDGLRHHYGVVRDTETTRLYIDGVLVSGLLGTTNVYSGDNTVFGAQFGGEGEYFSGTIDEMRIYSGTLSGVDIAALAAIPEPATTTSLLGAGALLVSLGLRRRSRP